MKRFAALFTALDRTTRTNDKVAALAAYFAQAPEADRLWTVALLSGRRPRRAVNATQLAGWAAEAAGVPLWLFAESYHVTGDLAETIALILPDPDRADPDGMDPGEAGRDRSDGNGAERDAADRIGTERDGADGNGADGNGADPGHTGPEAVAQGGPGPEDAPATAQPGAPGPTARDEDGESLSALIAGLRTLPARSEAERRDWILMQWARLPGDQRFLFNKLITGGFRMGVSAGLMTRALSRATGVEEAVLAHRLMGDWTPDSVTFASLVAEDAGQAGLSRPYPFCLASPLEAQAETLGPPEDWFAEWKWDGIRGQLIRRGGEIFLWSRGEELVTDRFPEFAAALDFIPDGTVIDGEILAWEAAGDGRPLPFAALQTRIGRKVLSKKVLAAAPVRMLAYDLIEWRGEDIRDRPLADRRARLDGLLAALPAEVPIGPSPLLGFDGWAHLAGLRDGSRGAVAEGLMIKRRASAYTGGRRRGDWWKWKVDPMTVDAVMVYAQAGHGRRATLFTDFTFAVRDGDDLVPFTKAYSGLTDAEFARITAWVRRNTLERFGPVRRVPPELVFEIAFEGIQPSPRHKSGVALRFPRMLRWRQDKPVAEIDTLDSLRSLLAAQGGGGQSDD